MEKLKHQNNELSKWQGYVEDDLDNIIWKMEKIEDDLNMRIGSKSDLLEESRNLVKFMKQTLYKYCPEKEEIKRVEGELSLQDINNKMKVIKDQLRETSSGSDKYLELISELEKLEKKQNKMENREDFYQDDEIYMKKEFTLGGLW